MILHERGWRRSKEKENTQRETGVRNKRLSRKDRASRTRNIVPHLKS